jgi:hypothetical protein
MDDEGVQLEYGRAQERLAAPKGNMAAGNKKGVAPVVGVHGMSPTVRDAVVRRVVPHECALLQENAKHQRRNHHFGDGRSPKDEPYGHENCEGTKVSVCPCRS